MRVLFNGFNEDKYMTDQIDNNAFIAYNSDGKMTMAEYWEWMGQYNAEPWLDNVWDYDYHSYGCDTMAEWIDDYMTDWEELFNPSVLMPDHSILPSMVDYWVAVGYWNYDPQPWWM